MKKIKELEKSLSESDRQKSDIVKSFVKTFSTSEKIRVLVDMLNTTKDPDYETIKEYLKMLSWEVIDPLVWALGELEHFPARRMVCQVLEVIGENYVELLAKGLESSRWYVVRNVVLILGKIGGTKVIKYFNNTIKHSDIRVRKATLMSASRISHSMASDFLITALKDEDESLQLLALKEIVRQNFINAFPYIEKIVKEKNFKDRSPEQIREFLESYARLGKYKAFDLLKSIATLKFYLPSERISRMKVYATRALSFIPGPSVKQLLQKLSKSRNRQIADIARRSLLKRSKEEQDD